MDMISMRFWMHWISARATKGKPSVILAHTVKGKGVPFMENVVVWHGKTPSKEDYEKAMEALA
ncbi:MAG: hypothetical protein ACLS61_14600 [Ruminococcus sp.]